MSHPISRSHWLAVSLFMAASLPIAAQSVKVSSPDGLTEIVFELQSGVPTYRVTRQGTPILAPSRLGLKLEQGPSLCDGLHLLSTRFDALDQTWEQPWGEKRLIGNHYQGFKVTLGSAAGSEPTLQLEFRAYDDGIAFRYLIPDQEGLSQLHVMDELTEFALPADHKAWWIPAFEGNRYEYLYEASPVSTLDRVHTPLTLETAQGLCLSIHEAALTDYSSMALRRTVDTTLKAELFPWADGVLVRGRTPMQSPWRTLQIADSPGGLITSYLILNLNEPNRLGDVSWIRPGKYVGVWWEMHLGLKTWGSGDRHGATTENTRRYIDFAATNGFSGVLVEGWNVGWDGDWTTNGSHFSFTQPYPDYDLQWLADYARSKGVYLIGHHETAGGIRNYEAQLDPAFALCEKLGIKAVKTGYVAHGTGIQAWDEEGRPTNEWHHGQFMVRHYRKVVEEAARHHVMLDVHEPIKPTGIRRTYPNMMTREGARGQEYNAWGGEGRNPPEHETILPFTRMLAGPMDFTPGIFKLTIDDIRPGNRVPTTLAKQLALYVVIYSPLQMAADLPENYLARPEAFQFIKDVVTDWEDTVVVNGRIGDYVTIGSVTDEEARTVSAPLTFLDPDVNYVAEIYRDGDGADCFGDPYPLIVEKKRVGHVDTLTLRLAPGGGQAIRFRALPSTE